MRRIQSLLPLLLFTVYVCLNWWSKWRLKRIWQSVYGEKRSLCQTVQYKRMHTTKAEIIESKAKTVKSENFESKILNSIQSFVSKIDLKIIKPKNSYENNRKIRSKSFEFKHRGHSVNVKRCIGFTIFYMLTYSPLWVYVYAMYSVDFVRNFSFWSKRQSWHRFIVIRKRFVFFFRSSTNVSAYRSVVT